MSKQGSNKIGGKSSKMDLKRYFNKVSSTSTRASGIPAAQAQSQQLDQLQETAQQQPQEQEIAQPRQPQQVDEGIKEFNPDHIIADPGLRIPIEDFHPDIRDQVRRVFLLKGPTQPIGHNYPRKTYGKNLRGFGESWFKKYDWLEYSVEKDAAYCFYCFLFKQQPLHEQLEDVQAMSLLIDVKARLINLRNHGWEPLFGEVKTFCDANKIPIPNMDEAIPRWGRSRRDGITVTQDHHYRVDTFFTAIDAITTEMDHRFNEVSSELLVCFSCLDPRDSFSKFDLDKIARLAEIYDKDFSIADRATIKDQLETFILHVRRVDDFIVCHDLGSLAVKMIETERHIVFSLVYRLMELALVLPVATSSVERVFSAMNIIKTDLRNKISNDWLNDLMVCYVEREIFKGLDRDRIKKRFQDMKSRRMKMPRSPRRN